MKRLIAYGILVVVCIGSLFAVHTNYAWYSKPIATITQMTVIETTEVEDSHGNKDTRYEQILQAQIKNGDYKGQTITLENSYSQSGAFDEKYAVGNDVFIAVDDKKNLQGHILQVKRDTYIVMMAWLFIFVLLVVGRKRGLLSLISFAINVTILVFALDIYIQVERVSLLAVCAVMVILFAAVSLIFVNGFNSKTYAAILATLIGTFSALAIAFIAMRVTQESGLHYEEMQFLTRPYHIVFMAGLLIGSLGAVMDVAITLASAIFALHDSDNSLTLGELKVSAKDIGKDIMGTITNILFFAYISGSFPMLLLYLKNGLPLGYTLSMNLSLELARALAGGIGVVLTIPITIYISLALIKRKQVQP